ncbi:MAG TPA: hypothetical protein VLH19_05515 [Patescibacteria group bacterium]|nr:hypothetical protein [Patescibacteria group bacterium]
MQSVVEIHIASGVFESKNGQVVHSSPYFSSLEVLKTYYDDLVSKSPEFEGAIVSVSERKIPVEKDVVEELVALLNDPTKGVQDLLRYLVRN